MTEEISAGNEDISANKISVDLAGATIALRDEDNDSITSEEDNSCNVFANSVVPANTNINVEGSSDVVIGTLAQFHGPVTIYQNTHNNTQLHSESPNYLTFGDKSPPSTTSTDARLVATESLSGNTFSSFGEIPFTQKKVPVIPLIVFVMLISICVIVGVSVGLYMNSEEMPLPMIDGDTGKNTQFKPILPKSKHKLIPRAGWNAHKPVYLRPMKVPVQYVIISHTAGTMCESFSDCIQTMRNIQDLHVKNESPDIGYNFVIGGDENIYEGRD
ncbi:Peptidoglycan recognition protein LE [Carabus blaptoides fortunei]